jgi:hypothetical protein
MHPAGKLLDNSVAELIAMMCRMCFVRRLFPFLIACVTVACSSPEPIAPSIPPSIPGPTTASLPMPSLELSPTPEPFPTPDLAERPQIWFGPLDPSPPDADRPYSGRLDFFNLFAPGAAWEQAARGIQVFKFYGGWLARSATLSELEPAIADLQRRGLGIAFEGGPLTPTSQCTGAIEGFAGPVEGGSAARRIQQAGGTLDYVDLEHPYDAVTFSDVPQACRYSPERAAQDVALYVQAIRNLFPNARFGAVETANNDPDQVARWVEAYRAVMGEDLAYFNFDLNYNDPNWAQNAKAIEDYLHGRGIEFGMFYRGDETDTTDAQWVAKAEERFVAYEVGAGGHPDRAIFQSWHPHPEHLLPESDPSTFTHLIDRYLRTRTELTLEAPSGSLPSQTIAGTLADAAGSPLADAVVQLRTTPLEGPGLAFGYTITGTVPDGATQADVGYRVNTECGCSGVGEFSLYRVRYTEGTGTLNLVPNGNFARAWEGWGAWGEGARKLVPSDLGSGTALHVTARAGQVAAINSSRFAVRGGAPFTVTFLARVSPATHGSGYFDLIFLDARQELRRFMIPLEPAPADLGQATTDSSGRFQMPFDAPISGRAMLSARYAGDDIYWPAYGEVLEGQ